MRFPKGPVSILVIVMCAGFAAASPQSGERNLSEDEIRDLTSGKTFHYTLRGESRGEEQHYADGRVTWRLPEGECMHGVWIAKEEILCYFYGIDRFGCWNVVADTASNPTQFSHASVDLDGERTDSPSVYINRISEEPVSCAPPQLVHFSH